MNLNLSFFYLVVTLILQFSANAQKAQIMIVGSDHLTQLYKSDMPNTDVLLAKQQEQMKGFTQLLIPYQPDLIMVEVLPGEQPRLDSLYTLYRHDKLKLDQLEDGRSEVYQLAFRLAKQLGLSKVHGVNAPGGTSQAILDNGDNISLYKDEGIALRKTVLAQVKLLQEGSLSIINYLRFINQPQTYNKVHHLRYITPARVRNGTFKNPDAMVDTAFINPSYIGAELISVFKNRDYKVYSNIVTTQLRTKAKRALLLIGAAHIGSLQSIFRDDTDYKLVDTTTYLGK
ncbi:DUF5694 domain-containing protein [Spirosoma sp. KNUC1025]|uniref:DUF5694 domain-containing protein n=1 Tax=Spirosoma sp. KNUC1025 TaxID=2894082 RepID=UPI001E542325|nr:DUF5694 domain-containing protein [Spirosoma sp. KNUC1025]UFH57505.1 DUF5694 domain-containing protein [Spirosoma sp. KNUC1025]